jgi:NlpC/P60 family
VTTYRYRHYRYRYRRRYGRYRSGQRMTPGEWLIAGLIVLALAGGSGAAVKGISVITGHTGSKVAQAISFAHAQLGCPYLWGGTGPCGTGFDCSGLVMQAFASAGVSIPRTSQAQWAMLPHVTHPHVGDLVFFAGADGTPASPGHVGLVLGQHWMEDAYATGTDIRDESFGLASSAAGLQDPVGFARPVPLVHAVRVATVSVPAGGYTPASWARALLAGAGYQPTACNLVAVTAWEAAEGGNWANAATYNPLNDTLPQPGSYPVNSKHVQAYTSWAQGLTATLTTLSGPDYGAIRSALAGGTSAQAVASSVWGTHPFTPASC